MVRIFPTNLNNDESAVVILGEEVEIEADHFENILFYLFF